MPKTCRGAVLYAVMLGVVCAVVPARAADPPVMMFSGLLNGVKLDYKTGDLSLERMNALNLPPPPGGGEYAPEGAAKLWAILSEVKMAPDPNAPAGGEKTVEQLTPHTRFDLSAQLASGVSWMVSSVWTINLKTNEKDFAARAKLTAGDYVLEFFLENGKFCRFPFTITTLPSPNADQPGDWYFLEGAWADWGYLMYAGANPEEALAFKMWLRSRAHEAPKSVKVTMEIRSALDNKVIGTNRPDFTYDLTPEWVRVTFEVIHPMVGTGGGAQFQAGDLLKTDGAYTLTLALNGQPYGTWKFQVAGGKLAPVGRTVRAETDPLSFVEGGGDAFWYEKGKGEG